jgi:hypothetical protein
MWLHLGALIGQVGAVKEELELDDETSVSDVIKMAASHRLDKV